MRDQLGRLRPLLFIGALLLAWEFAARSGWWSPLLFPSLGQFRICVRILGGCVFIESPNGHPAHIAHQAGHIAEHDRIRILRQWNRCQRFLVPLRIHQGRCGQSSNSVLRPQMNFSKFS